MKLEQVSPRGDKESPRSKRFLNNASPSPEQSPRGESNEAGSSQLNRSVMDLKARAALRKAQQNRPEIPRIEDMVKRKDDFGIEEYQVPKYRGKEVVLYDIGKRRSPMTKEKKESYMEWAAKKKKDLPSPAQYSPI